jgi:hypothetical protein
MRILLPCLLFFVSFPAFCASTDAPGGTVVSLTGTARNLTRNQDLAAGSAVWAGDHITTGGDSSARITLGNDIAIQVGPSSDIVIQHEVSKPWSLELVSGMVGSVIRKAVKGALSSEPKFELHTGSAVMGVRGTMFFVKRLGPKKFFLCPCMGSLDVKVAGGKIQKTIVSKNHEFAQNIDESEVTPKSSPAEMGTDHTDKDMNELKALLK